MHHLQPVLCSLLNSNEFLAAIAGAVVGGIFVVITQLLSTLWQRGSERAAERHAVIGILQAIETEIEMFQTKYLKAFKKLFLDPEPEKAKERLPQIASIKSSISIVFDSNAGALGRITDVTLRADIVSTYLTLKAVVDTVNHYADRRAAWEGVRYQKDVIGINEIRAQAEGWAQSVRNGLPKLENEMSGLLANIRKYAVETS